MNYYHAFQPEGLGGKWQYAQLSRRGGGPICGCAFDQGHDTAEEAERHFYDTQVADLLSWGAHFWDEGDAQRKCEVCGEWTTRRTTIRLRHFHEDVHSLCATCVPELTDEMIRRLVPFRTGFTSYGTS